MNTTRTMWTRMTAAGSAAGALLLLAGVMLGLRLGSATAEHAPAAAAPEQERPGGMAEMGGAQEMPGMEGMTMTDDGTVRIARPVAGALGIVAVPVELAALRREIRATGHVTYDETLLSRVAPRFGGWIERLHVDFTGRFVRAGEPLLEIYSPELVSAQEELLAARRLEESLAGSVAPGVSDRTGDLVEAARRRLRLWEISPEQIRALEERGEVRSTLTLHAPTAGFVLEKDAELGGSVEAGATLFRVADLSRVWLDIDVFEQDLRLARLGDPVDIRVDAYPGERRTGRIGYVYPDVNRATRAGRVRVEIPNPDRRLVPGMFATAYIDAVVAERAVVVPRDAVLHFGDRDIVFVEQEVGSYEIREVQVGATSGDRTEILRGLAADERVVARANFFLDAESRLMESMMGMPGMEMDMEMDQHMDMDEDMDMDEGMDMDMDMDMPGMRTPGTDRE